MERNLPEGYVRSMAKAMNLHLPTLLEVVGENFQAIHVFSTLYKALWDAHRYGMWPSLLLDASLPHELPTLANPNRDSWELGAINSGYTSDMVLDIFGHRDNQRDCQNGRSPTTSCRRRLVLWRRFGGLGISSTTIWYGIRHHSQQTRNGGFTLHKRKRRMGHYILCFACLPFKDVVGEIFIWQ
jgi:hypothetical protein